MPIVSEGQRQALGDGGETVAEGVIENKVTTRPQGQHAGSTAAAVAEAG